jgi:hypothetical protein
MLSTPLVHLYFALTLHALSQTLLFSDARGCDAHLLHVLVVSASADNMGTNLTFTRITIEQQGL